MATGAEPRRRNTLICVPLMVDAEDHAASLDDAQRAMDSGADMVEYRIDRLFHGEGDDEGIAATLDLCARSPLPCIVTCRPTWEGGEYDGEDTDRVSLFEALGTADHPPAYIDIELAAYARSANLRQKVNLAVQHPGQVRDVRTRLILSSHDFERRPADLDRRRAQMAGYPAAAVHKLAYRARSLRDAPECLEIAQRSPVPAIALAMGEYGLLSRVLAPKAHALLTFAALDKGEQTAPGQPTLHELIHIYRFREIDSRTPVYGVIGDPVAHSRSPIVHNAIMAKLGVPGIYLPLPIAGAADEQDSALSFKATLIALMDDPIVGLAGASVTIPHKINALRFAQKDDARTWHIDPLAILAGAVNTLARDGGSWRASNTDASAITALLKPHATRDGVAATVVGAGGVARGAVAACVELGTPVRIIARRPEQAAALRDDMLSIRPEASIDVGLFDERDAITTCIAIQCTPIGMAGGPDPDGLALRFANDAIDPLLLETVYTPMETHTVAAARSQGASIITGDQMFIEQAVEQAVIWHGVAAGDDAIVRVARAAVVASG